MISNEALLLVAARIIIENYIRESKIFLTLKSPNEKTKTNPTSKKLDQIVEQAKNGGPLKGKKYAGDHWMQKPENREKMINQVRKMNGNVK